jgi:hypothetical protein
MDEEGDSIENLYSSCLIYSPREAAVAILEIVNGISLPSALLALEVRLIKKVKNLF